ncbi:Endoribonuclease L-PSP [Desarmillaria tabescens]|uniref:Endoribonuclease L-PSP n=1 Tax=Armillaria tabescens TaxID=1929756 RepID=A0AA39U1A7_ARMTA|nr:Endoribonuclease L-PSP [Desarmillaria tabescens]KAK0465060.1 Endoribonuclease L-PSP [Desarmillaria tabescens]
MSIERINSLENSSFTHILCKLASNDCVLLCRSLLISTSAHATKVSGLGLIFLSGTTPIDKTGTLVPGGIQEHTAQCLANLGNVLAASGSSWEKVIKVNVYLKDMDNFAAMNEIYEKTLPNPKPSRTCIQAAKLPNDVDIEIEAIAAV